MIASIPSPSTDVIDLGPLEIRLYGLFIALGVVAVVLMVRWRLTQRSLDPDISVILAWIVVPAGLVGARIYHVITDWKQYQDDWLDAFKIWEGGLGIPGAVIGGVLAGAAVCRHFKWNLSQQLDIVAVALPLGQAIGRLGNWFNQELFGRPTDLPWGLEIDRENIPPEYQAEAARSDITFHPTFLYEALWNLGLMGVLLWVDSKRKLPTGHLFACYVLGYASGRIWIELLRIDEASKLLGVRVNVWVMSALWLGALAWLLLRRDRPSSDATDSEPAHLDEDSASDLEPTSDSEPAFDQDPGSDRESAAHVSSRTVRAVEPQSAETGPEVFDFEADLGEASDSPRQASPEQNSPKQASPEQNSPKQASPEQSAPKPEQ